MIVRLCNLKIKGIKEEYLCIEWLKIYSILKRNEVKEKFYFLMIDILGLSFNWSGLVMFWDVLICFSLMRL